MVYLTVPSGETAQGVANTFKHALGDLGWIDGQNVLIDYRFADSSLDRLPDLAAGLVQLRADVIVAGANAAVAAAKAVTQAPAAAGLRQTGLLGGPDPLQVAYLDTAELPSLAAPERDRGLSPF